MDVHVTRVYLLPIAYPERIAQSGDGNWGSQRGSGR